MFDLHLIQWVVHVHAWRGDHGGVALHCHHSVGSFVHCHHHMQQYGVAMTTTSYTTTLTCDGGLWQCGLALPVLDNNDIYTRIATHTHKHTH